MMDNKTDVTEYLQHLADEFIREKRYEDAILLFRKLAKMHPDKESYVLMLAWAYHDGGMKKDAVDCFEQLLAMELERKVFTGFAFDELVRILKEEEDYERLVEICEKVTAVQCDDIALLGDLGDAYLTAGKASQAIEVYRRMTEMEPDASVNFCHLGNALIAEGNFDGAEEAYQKAIDIDPSEAATYYDRLAGAYVEAGCYERAEAALGRCIENKVNEPAYYTMLGDVLVKQGRLHDAENAYEKAIALNKDNGGAYYNRLGNALAKAGYHLQAVEIFKKAVAADHKNPFYYLRLAESYNALGLSDMAEKTFFEAEMLKK